MQRTLDDRGPAEGLDGNAAVHPLGHFDGLLRHERGLVRWHPLKLCPLPVLSVAVFPQLLQALTA